MGFQMLRPGPMLRTTALLLPAAAMVLARRGRLTFNLRDEDAASRPAVSAAEMRPGSLYFPTAERVSADGERRHRHRKRELNFGIDRSYNPTRHNMH